MVLTPHLDILPSLNAPAFWAVQHLHAGPAACLTWLASKLIHKLHCPCYAQEATSSRDLFLIPRLPNRKALTLSVRR